MHLNAVKLVHMFRREALEACFFALIPLIGVLDYVTGPEISFGLFYLAPVALISWAGGRNRGVLAAVLSAICWLLADRFSDKSYSNAAIPFWNALVRLVFFLIGAYLVALTKEFNSRLEALVDERTKSLHEQAAGRLKAEQGMLAVIRREQHRLAQDLHDGFAGYLGSIAIKVKLHADELNRRGSPSSKEAEQIFALVSNAMGQARAMARNLDPVSVEQHGLVELLRKLAADTESFFGMSIGFQAKCPTLELPCETALNLYRIAQEALQNAFRHGGFKNVSIELRQTDHAALLLEVKDEGDGFSPADRRASEGMGLMIMEYRATAIGATLQIDSQKGLGTRVRCLLPAVKLQTPHPSNGDWTTDQRSAAEPGGAATK